MLSVLLLLSLVTRVYGSYADRVAAAYTKSLEKAAQIDWSKPPFIEKAIQPPQCDRWPPRRPWKLRKELHQPFFGGSRGITVDYDAVPQRRFLNINKGDVPLHQEDSTWETKGWSDSWSAGAALISGHLQLSSSFSRTNFEQTMTIKSLGLSERCPGGYECHFEDWIYHITFHGRCKTQLTNWYGDICKDEEAKKAEQSCKPERARQWCSYYRRSACQFRVPIIDGNGKPLTTTVFIKKSYENKQRPWAIKAAQDCMFMLDSGEWYDSEHDLLSVPVADDLLLWVAREEDQLAPVIPLALRRPDCPASKDKKIHRRDREKRSTDEMKIVGVKVVAGFKGFGGTGSFLV